MQTPSPVWPSNALDLRGWHVLITGSNSGIGFETPAALAARGNKLANLLFAREFGRRLAASGRTTGSVAATRQPVAPEYAVAARRADLSGLPPTWIATSDIDLLYDEALHYRERLEASGVPCRLHVVPQAPHGFEALVPRSRLALALLRANCAFLREAMTLEAVSAEILRRA